MSTTARRKNPTSPVSRPMADVSAMIWFPWPEEWPLPTPEAMAADARRRARHYVGSKFWGRPCKAWKAKPLVQGELFA